MVTAAFTELVTRLRDTYLDSVPKDARRKHARHIQMTLSGKELDEEAANEEAELSRQFQALPLGIIDHLWFFLQPDGKLLAFNLYYDEVTAESDADHDRDYGLRTGSDRFPELKSLMTPRPPAATDCPVCAGKGWAPKVKGDGEVACGRCWGRGWFPPGLAELTERTAESLRLAGADYDATDAAIRAFLADGLALGLGAAMLCNGFERAALVAGYDDDQRELRQRHCSAIANESHFPGGWPYYLPQ